MRRGVKNKALALGPGGAIFFPIALDTVEETVRRALESCGGIAGVPCMIVALNDSFVVPIPATLKVTGFFKAAGNTMIIGRCPRRCRTPDRGGVKRLERRRGRGAGGRPGLGLKAAHRTGRCQPLPARLPIASSATAIARLLRLARFRSDRTSPRLAGAWIRSIWSWRSLGVPEGRGPPAHGQQHEQVPVALIAGSRTGAFAPAHDRRAIVVVHPPLPTPAAPGYNHFHHVR